MDKQILPSDTKGQIFNLTVSHAVNRDTIASAMAATPSSVLALEIKRLNRVIVKTNNLKKTEAHSQNMLKMASTHFGRTESTRIIFVNWSLLAVKYTQHIKL